ncbi:MAG: hypothetical protein JWO79_5106 [Actinomycetia bacterium]|nr:hypothetical protein [Actinomycetes bacterium]
MTDQHHDAGQAAGPPGIPPGRPTASGARATEDAEPGRPWWHRPNGRVATMSIALLVVTAVAQIPWVLHGIGFRDKGIVPLWVLFLLFAATEGFVIHLRVRRGGHAVSLSEIPLVLGLLGTDPVLFLLTRIVAGAIGLALFRRQRGVKLLFNVALLGITSLVAIFLFHQIAGPSTELGPRQWIAAYTAMFVTDVLAVVLVTAAIAFHDDRGEWKRLRAAMQGTPLVAITTSFALLTALVARTDPRAVALLGVVSLAAYLAYRGYARQSQGHAQVEELYEFTRALGNSLDTREVVRIVLDQARDQLRAEKAELLVPSLDGHGFLQIQMIGQGEVVSNRIDELPQGEWWAPAADGQPVLQPLGTTKPARAKRGRGAADVYADGMAVPVQLGELTGVLLVSGSLADITTFEEEHLRLFQALANHASVSLANVQLVDKLRREATEKEHLALHDPLTGLANRRQFQTLVDAALAATPDDTFAVMLMDLDQFKEVNDALGHDTGDALLHEVGARLQRRLGARGLVARLGGDEFAVLLPSISSREDALAVGEDLTHAMERPVPVGHLMLDARASIGISFAPDHGDNANTLIQRADVAMYAAKKARSGVRVYQPEDDQNTPTRLAFIADLRTAIQRCELDVVFQPKVDPRTGAVIGAEALSRWHRTGHGFVPPDQFIEIAEHSGLIRPLTFQVLETALARCAEWRAKGHMLHVAVNLSPSSLVDRTLSDTVARLLVQAGLPASALTLEITESSIMADPARSLATLDGLHALGVKLSIDDFGTGYSSLGRLRSLPIQEVKIDKSFVQRLMHDASDQAVAHSAIQLGHALGLQVVAEGVEDAETAAHLAKVGCNVIQGYYISKPVDHLSLLTWLAERASNADPKVIYPRFGT